MTVQINGDNTIAAPGFSGPDADTGLQTATNELSLVTGGSARLFIDASGDVGVGTSSPNKNSWAGPAVTLQCSTNGAYEISDGNTLAAAFGLQGDDRIEIINFRSGPLTFKTGNTERLRIDSSGRVGIGTSTITEKLTLISNNDTSAVDNGLGIYRSTGDDKVTINCQGGAARFIADGGSSYIPFRFARYNGTTLVEDLHISSSGNIGIGKVSSGNKLEIEGQGNTKVVIDGRTDAANGSDAILELWSKNSSGTNNFGFIDYDGDGNFEIGSGGSGAGSVPLVFKTNATERMRIDSQGRLLVRTSTARDNFFNSANFRPFIQLEGTNAESSRLSIVRNQNDSGGPGLILGKSRGTSAGSETVAQNNDDLGLISFQGADGDSMVEAARIQADVNGTPGSNDMPGQLSFFTNSGTTTVSERLRITSGGAWGLGGANYGSSGQVLTSQGSGSAPQWATPQWVDHGADTLSGSGGTTVTGISTNARQVRIVFTDVSVNGTLSPQIVLRLGNGSISTSSYQGRVFESNTNETQATGTGQINIAHSGHTAASHSWSGIIEISMCGSGVTVCWSLFTNLNHCEFGAARWQGNNTIDRINFFTSSGSFDAGVVKVFSDV